MSFGFISIMFPLKITPSTTIKGANSPEREDCPLIWIFGSCPARLTCPTVRPGIDPCSDSITDRFGDSRNASISARTTEPVRSLFLCSIPNCHHFFNPNHILFHPHFNTRLAPNNHFLCSHPNERKD